MADGHVVDDPGHVTVALGDHVVLKIAADVSDEIHVHGYDLMEDVAEGEPATIAFNADIPGQFEAELEQHHQTILEFDVR